MRVLNVNSTLGLKKGGGTAERTFQMSRHLALLGMPTTVLTLDLELDLQRQKDVAPATVIALQALWERFYIPRVNWKIIREAVDNADVVHLMGHWGVVNALVYLAVRRAKKPYVVCPAGALPLFGRSFVLKWLYNLFIGKALIRNAAAWIAVTEAEFQQFQAYGVPSTKIRVIPNGVNKEDFPLTERQVFLQRHAIPDAPYILFMGRLNQIKGPDLLLDAYSLVEKNFPGCQLVFAGPDDGMLPLLKIQADEHGLSNQIHFIGYVDGEDKASAYRHARLLVVPSRLEAMSIVVLEGGICGTPVLLTDQCGFPQIREVDARLEVSPSAEGLARGLSALLADPQELAAIGKKMQNFVEAKFTWRSTVGGYVRLYEQLLQNHQNI